MSNETKKQKVEDFVHPCVLERAKHLWGDMHDPDGDVFHWLIIGAEMGYSYAITEMQNKLFDMGKKGNNHEQLDMHQSGSSEIPNNCGKGGGER